MSELQTLSSNFGRIKSKFTLLTTRVNDNDNQHKGNLPILGQLEWTIVQLFSKKRQQAYNQLIVMLRWCVQALKANCID